MTTRIMCVRRWYAAIAETSWNKAVDAVCLRLLSWSGPARGTTSSSHGEHLHDYVVRAPRATRVGTRGSGPLPGSTIFSSAHKTVETDCTLGQAARFGHRSECCVGRRVAAAVRAILLPARFLAGIPKSPRRRGNNRINGNRRFGFAPACCGLFRSPPVNLIHSVKGEATNRE